MEKRAPSEPSSFISEMSRVGYRHKKGKSLRTSSGSAFHLFHREWEGKKKKKKKRNNLKRKETEKLIPCTE